MATKAIANLRVHLTAVTSQFSSGMKRAKSELRGFRGAALTANTALKTLGVGLAGVISIRGLGGMISGSLQSIDALNDLAKKLDTTTEGLYGLQRAAQLGGSSGDALASALDKMSNNISEANNGSKALMATFAELGLDTKELIGLKADQQFLRIADAFKTIANQSDKIRLSKDIFGKSGGDLLQLLSGGSAELQKVIDDTIASGEAPLTAQAEQAAKAQDAIDNLSLAWQGLKNQLAIGVSPAIERLAELFDGFGLAGVGAANKIQQALLGVEGAAYGVIGALGGALGFFGGGRGLRNTADKGINSVLDRMLKNAISGIGTPIPADVLASRAADKSPSQLFENKMDPRSKGTGTGASGGLPGYLESLARSVGGAAKLKQAAMNQVEAVKAVDESADELIALADPEVVRDEERDREERQPQDPGEFGSGKIFNAGVSGPGSQRGQLIAAQLRGNELLQIIANRLNTGISVMV